ncbi:hypothetical protein V9T40_007292 [Parthenolecanium corni]|uniref:PH domain-containing protein n=1 Tax=Parthenolecanium corni TaxID=536013 RepID=A0AAN9YBH3_9HEMI
MDDVALSFQLEVVVVGVEGLKSVTANKIIYCTIEVEGEGKLQSEHMEASKAVWNTQGDFTLAHPLPVVKLKLYAENAGMLALEDKELGKLTLHPNPHSPQVAELHQMVVAKNSPDQNLKMKVICRMESPPNMKHCGYLYALGKVAWKKWKKRYHVLYEVADKLYALCSFKEKKEKKLENNESILLDGYFVDYIEPNKAQLMVGTQIKGGSHFFSATKEGDTVLFATEDEKECRSWVAALYKSTGQSHKPAPSSTSKSDNNVNSTPNKSGNNTGSTAVKR